MLLLGLCVWAGLVRSTSSADLGSFSNPPETGGGLDASAVWTYNTTERLQWSTTIDKYYIKMMQQLNDDENTVGTIFTENGGGVSEQSVDWVVSPYTSDTSVSNVYYFWLRDRESSASVYSHLFTIDYATQSSSNAPEPSDLQTVTQTASLVAEGTSAPSTIPTSSPSSLSPADNNARKIGLGVGIGVGVPLLLVLALWIALKIVRSRKPAPPKKDAARPITPGAEEGDHGGPGSLGDKNRVPETYEAYRGIHEVHSQPRILEASDQRQIYEAPNEQRIYEAPGNVKDLEKLGWRGSLRADFVSFLRV